MVRTSFMLVGTLALMMTFSAHAENFENNGCAEGIKASLASKSETVYDSKKIKDGTSVIDIKGHALESPVVSSDGKRMIVVGSPFSEKFPATQIFIKDLTNPNDVGIKLKKPLLNIFVKGSFIPNAEYIAGAEGGMVVCELKWKFGAIIKYLLKRPEGEAYHSIISVFDKSGNRLKEFSPADFGLPKTTFLEHPRVSPDGRFMTFYTQSSKEIQGVYIYDLKANLGKESTIRLTAPDAKFGQTFLDKHPTFDNTGKRIFFHEQGAMQGTGEEIARIGYYDLDLDGGTVKVARRVIIGDPKHEIGTNYVYQKHPAYHSGLNMVFFHARDGITGSKSIGAISLDHLDQQPLFFELRNDLPNGDEMRFTHAEHVDVSDQPNSPLYFVAREKLVTKSELDAKQAAKDAADASGTGDVLAETPSGAVVKVKKDEVSHLTTVSYEALLAMKQKFIDKAAKNAAK
jgi:hypothetical protein